MPLASCQHVSPGPGNENRFQIAANLKARLTGGLWNLWALVSRRGVAGGSEQEMGLPLACR
jgi:hypothetical protein